MRRSGWRVKELGELVGIPLRTLSRIAEHSLGITAKTWLRQQRMIAACHELRHCGRITTIVEEFGFRHISSFTREFKAVIGVTPTEFLRCEMSRSTLLLHEPSTAEVADYGK